MRDSPLLREACFRGLARSRSNLDNGAGKIRGVYAEDSVATAPMLKKWLAPFASMGAGRVVMSRPTLCHAPPSPPILGA